MKLIDLLKQELPNRGGWPDGAVQCAQDDNGNIYFYTEGRIHYGVYSRGCWTIPAGSRAASIRKATLEFDRSDDNATTIVTREQYEAATVWSVVTLINGLPQTGAECEIYFGKDDEPKWWYFKLLFKSKNNIVCIVGDEEVVYKPLHFEHLHVEFRPIRTEREKGIEAMLDLLNAGTQLSLADAIEQLYDAGYRKV